MGRKKKRPQKPVCWYCERAFDDEKILIQHQKAKHFKCHVCHKKLSTAGGMVVHVAQVHKETILKVPNSKEGRDSIQYEIYGMDGVPDLEEDGGPSKKPKLEMGSAPSVISPPVAAPSLLGAYPTPPMPMAAWGQQPQPTPMGGPWGAAPWMMAPPMSGVPGMPPVMPYGMPTPAFSGQAAQSTVSGQQGTSSPLFAFLRTGGQALQAWMLYVLHCVIMLALLHIWHVRNISCADASIPCLSR